MGRRLLFVIWGIWAFTLAGVAFQSDLWGPLGPALILVGLGCFAGALTVGMWE